jgi:hypothetical protein
MILRSSTALVVALWLQSLSSSQAFSNLRLSRTQRQSKTVVFSDWKDDALDSNKWKSTNDVLEEQEDWQDIMSRRKDGSFWTAFESSDDDSEIAADSSTDSVPEIDESEAWLDTLASLQAEEVQFNMKEADRADKVRQMQEWGFDSATIQSTLDVAVDLSREADEVLGMQTYREESYDDWEDLTLVESHTKVEKDPDTGEPVRTQMVYVDEHTCIGE